MNSPDKITALNPNQVFVFGANEAGIHGAGAAKYARDMGWATQGVYGCLDRCSYGIATKDKNILTLPLSAIHQNVWRFLDLADSHPDLEFLVTPIGCGLAGYQPADIAPMFRDSPRNVLLPIVFTDTYRLPGPQGGLFATGTEARVIEDIINRQQKGIAKYGTTVAHNPLSLREWLNHAFEESLDQAIYLKRAIEEIDEQNRAIRK